MRYYIKTFGCQMNASDSERIAGFLESYKIKTGKETAKADLVIFNTCGVRQTAENRVFGLVHNLRKQNPNVKIVITGCLAERKDVQRKLKGKVDLFFTINELKFFENFLIENCKLKILKQSASGTTQEKISYLSIQPIYTDSAKAFVPIMTGCNNFCSYCVVPYARGREVSRPVRDIVSEINLLSKNGCKEITLLGQNVNSYQFIDMNSSAVEAGINFPILLNKLAQSYPKINFKFLTSHPRDFSEELMSVIAQNKNISREIHLPIQAGSDKILKAMNRPYTRKHYLRLIEQAREKISGVTFTTDVIVGFPTETEEDFQKTVAVFKKVGYNEAYINKYSPRPGTAAFVLGDPIAWEEKKRREKQLRNTLKK